MSDLSVQETAARAAFEANPPKTRHDGSDVTWHEATVSPWAGHWVREVEAARRQGNAVLAAVADHDGLADVLAEHESCGWRERPDGSGVMTCGMDLPPAGPSLRSAHLADVVRACLVES